MICTEERIIKVLTNVFDITEEHYTENFNRSKVAKWDSLRHMDLVVSLEREFNVLLTIDDIIALDGIDSIKSILKSKGVL